MFCICAGALIYNKAKALGPGAGENRKNLTAPKREIKLAEGEWPEDGRSDASFSSVDDRDLVNAVRRATWRPDNVRIVGADGRELARR